VVALALPGKPDANGFNAVLVAPFGLLLSSGVSFNVGRAPTPQASLSAAFPTCVPRGGCCPSCAKRQHAEGVARGDTAVVSMTASGTKQPIQVILFLNGLAAAHRRLVGLAAEPD